MSALVSSLEIPCILNFPLYISLFSRLFIICGGVCFISCWWLVSNDAFVVSSWILMRPNLQPLHVLVCFQDPFDTLYLTSQSCRTCFPCCCINVLKSICPSCSLQFGSCTASLVMLGSCGARLCWYSELGFIPSRILWISQWHVFCWCLACQRSFVCLCTC